MSETQAAHKAEDLQTSRCDQESQGRESTSGPFHIQMLITFRYQGRKDTIHNTRNRKTVLKLRGIKEG